MTKTIEESLPEDDMPHFEDDDLAFETEESEELQQGEGEDETFSALCGALPDNVQKAYLSYGAKFKKGYLALNRGEFSDAADYLSRAMSENQASDSFIPLELATAYLNLFMEAGASLGETVLLHAGASGVGTAAIQLCRQRGLRARTGADSRRRRRGSRAARALPAGGPGSGGSSRRRCPGKGRSGDARSRPAPGRPPGNTSMSYSCFNASSSVISANSTTPLEARTGALSKPAVTT